jgi:DNA-binding NarL/FixJ family response regulator
VIHRLLAGPAPSAGPPAAIADLTSRELTVLEHLARGLSNAEIAQALFVSEGTVKTHVARILSKLNLRDRIQAVIFAYETGLIRPGLADPPRFG